MKIGKSFSSIALIGLVALSVAPRLMAQTFSVNPTTITLNAPASSTNVVTQPLAISVVNGGGQTLTVSAASTGWLKVSIAGTCNIPVNGCALSPGSTVNVVVQADPTGLAQNTYTGSVSVVLTGGSSPVQIPVSFIVGTGSGGGGAGVIVASPTALNFSGLPGSGGQTQNVSLTNSGNAISYTVSSNQNWLTTNLGSNSGSSPGTLSVIANASLLAVGNYSGTLTLTPTGGGQTTTIGVSFVVSSSQQFQINPSALNLSFVSGSGAANPFANLSIGVTTGSPVSYAVATTYNNGSNWLSTNPQNGGTSGTASVPNPMTVTAIPGALTAGTYTATLTFTANGLPNVNIPVTLVVGAAPTLVASPNPVLITLQPNTTSSRMLNLTTSNGTAVNYTITPQYQFPAPPAVNWLTVSPSTGTTSAGGITIGVSPLSLPVGTYTAVLVVSSSTPGVASINVPITMTVTTSQIVTTSTSSLSFNFTGGGAAPASQFVSLGLNPASPIQTATVGAVPDVPGQTWLSASLSSPNGSQITGNAAVIVTVNPVGLANGTYTGKVQINISGGAGVSNPLVEIPVTFTVNGVVGGGGGTATTTVLLSQGQLTYNTTPGGTLDQTLTLTSNTTTQVPFILSTTTPWISILNSGGTTPGAPIIRVITTGLAAGTYNGQITMAATGAANNGAIIPVTLTVSAQNQLQTIPSGFNFNYTAGTSNFPNAQSLTVATSTGSPLPGTATFTTNAGGQWLNVTPTTFTTQTTIQVSINSSVLLSLQAGTYSGNITLLAPGALNSSVNVPVTLTVTGSGGGGGTVNDSLVLAPSPINFFSNVGGSVSSQIVDILTLAGSTLNYSVTSATTSGGAWLSTSPINGQTPGQLVVTANTAGLVAGVYNGGITVSAPGALNSGTTIPVSLTVSTQTNLVANPSGATFTYALGGSGSTQQKVITLTSTQNNAVPFTVTTNALSGLTVSTNSNTTPASITVSMNPVGYPAGVHTGTIFINATGVSNSPLSLPVTLLVTGTGGGTSQLALSPNALSFIGQPNGTPPSQRTVQVTSTGINSSFAVSSNQTWLLAGPSTGTTPGTITVGVNPTGLAVGTYQGNVTVTGGGVTASLPVTFEITNNPILQLSQQSVTYNYQTGQTLPAPRPILVTTSNGSALTASVNVATSNGGNWLSATPISLQTPGVFALSISPSLVPTLAAGTYTGTVTVSAPGAANSSTVINVTLNVSASPLITMSTTPITFNAQFNGNTPPSQSRQITATSGSLNVSVSTSTSTGTGWLSASINSNTTPATLTISASAFGLGTSIYTGTVTVSSGGAATALVIPVTLNVSSQPLISVDKSELIYGSGGNSGTAPQTLNISSSSSNFNYSVSTTVTNSPTNWLSVSSVTGVTPSALTVTVNPALLGDGTYFGTVVINAPSTGNTPLVIPVTLTVNQSTALQVNPATLTFTQVQGAAIPAQQPVQVTSQLPTTFNVTSAVQSPVGGNWLNVTQSGGLTNGFVQVGLNNSASALPVGTYTATVTVFGPSSPNQVPITVTLNVVSSASLQATPTTLSFNGRVGQANPATQVVQLASSNATTPVAFNITSDASWLTATPVSGGTPSSINVAASATGLTAGSYTGRLTITPTGVAGGQTAVITVTFVVEQVPLPNVTGVANAATFIPGSLSPGMIITLVGSNLGPTAASNGQVVGGRFTTSLAGTRVLFDGIAAPVLYASATQINAVVPYSMAGRASARMTVEYNGVVSTVIEPRMVDTAPGIFTTDGRQVAMFNENGTYNSGANPAPAGSIVVLYVTGEGSTTPAGVDGEVVGSNLKKPLAPVRVRVGGVEVPAADIFYAGSAPQLVSGLMQINFRIPATSPTGANVAVEVIIGSGQSQSGTTMAVR